MTRWLGVGVLLAASIVPAVAHADPDRKACLAAVDEGQKNRDEGKLAQAKKQFLTCSAKTCGAAVSKQCEQWYEEVDKDVPSVLFRAKDGAGKEIVDVKVLVDGAKVSDSISAQPLTLDPKEHTIRFEKADGTGVEDKFVLRVGEKNRMIELAFPAPAVAAPPPPVTPAPPPESKFHVPLLGYVGGGVFVAGAATTVIFAVMAHSKESDLRSSCAPNCSNDDRDGIKTKLAIANVGMFVGLAGLGVGVVATILANRQPEKTGSNGVHVVAGPTGIAGTF